MRSINQLIDEAGFARPYVHPNGFIQLDVNEVERLHFWGDERIPRQKISSPIHDHIFGFSSEILKGSLLNIEYEVESLANFAMNTHEVWVPTSDNRQLDAEVFHPQVTPVRRRSTLNWEGGAYYQEPFVFHETQVTQPTVTVITKDGPTLSQDNTGAKPRILVPINVQPDNTFDRFSFDDDQLWQIIRDIVNG